MATIPIPLLLISGPVGVGKTTVGNEVSSSLERRGVAHTFIDMDALAWTYPRPPDDRFGKKLALLNLRDVWTNCAAKGSHNLIIARVIETRQDVEQIERAVPGARSLVCQLRANDETLIDRVRTRELGSGRDWHEARALELARSLQNKAPADFVVDTDGRLVSDIADEIVGQVEWATVTL
jgi:DNA polymerase III delta prime subunit